MQIWSLSKVITPELISKFIGIQSKCTGPATTLNGKQQRQLPEAVRKQCPGGHKLSLAAHPLVKEKLALCPALSNTDRQWSLENKSVFFKQQCQHQSRILWKHSCNTSDCRVINEPFHMKQSWQDAGQHYKNTKCHFILFKWWFSTQNFNQVFQKVLHIYKTDFCQHHKITHICNTYI